MKWHYITEFSGVSNVLHRQNLKLIVQVWDTLPYLRVKLGKEDVGDEQEG